MKSFIATVVIIFSKHYFKFAERGATVFESFLKIKYSDFYHHLTVFICIKQITGAVSLPISKNLKNTSRLTENSVNTNIIFAFC